MTALFRNGYSRPLPPGMMQENDHLRLHRTSITLHTVWDIAKVLQVQLLRTGQVPPSLQCETAIPPKPPTSPSVSWPRLCWNRRLSWLGGLPSPLCSHRVSLESALAAPVYTQKTDRPLIFSFLVQQVHTDQETKTATAVRATFRSDITTPLRLKSKTTEGWIQE